DLQLREIEQVLEPELRAAGAPFEHVEVWETSPESPALREMRSWGARSRPDLVMVREPDAGAPEPSSVAVREITDPHPAFWPWFRKSLMEFEETSSEEVLDQLVARTRAVFVPAGLRWFVACVAGALAGLT